MNHSILLTKLEHYGVRGNALKLIQSYLSNRKHHIQGANIKSSLNSIISGVYQSSIIGPLFLLIFINDLPKSNTMKSILFADDRVLVQTDNNLGKLQNSFNQEMTKVMDWLTANKLSLNISKTKYMLITSIHVSTESFVINVNSNRIETTLTYKYLGVIADENLTWIEHCKQLCSTISKYVGVMHQVKHYVNNQALRMLYHSLINSRAQYGIIAWGRAASRHLQPISVVSNHATRCLNTDELLTNKVTTIYKMQKILQLKDIYNLEVRKFKHKYTTSQLPATFNNYFELITDVHSYNTRQIKTRQFALPNARSNSGAKMLKHSALEILSKIPPEIKNKTCLALFLEEYRNMYYSATRTIFYVYIYCCT